TGVQTCALPIYKLLVKILKVMRRMISFRFVFIVKNSFYNGVYSQKKPQHSKQANSDTYCKYDVVKWVILIFERRVYNDRAKEHQWHCQGYFSKAFHHRLFVNLWCAHFYKIL